MRSRDARGFGLVEMLVGITVFLLASVAIFGITMHGARINKSQRMAADVQANARICLTLVVQKLRSAGWDPMNAGVSTIALDPVPSDDVSQIEVFADLDEDGLTDGAKEQIVIRHKDGRVEWRPTNVSSDPFVLIADHISNDADGDGTPEPMFVPDSVADPTRITVTVTAQSPRLDPATGRVIRYTVSSDVMLRERL